MTKISYWVLRTPFQKSGQVAFYENIHRVRLDQARLLLTDEGLSVKDLAAQMHFPNEFSSSHFFHQRNPMKPAEFPRHLQK